MIGLLAEAVAAYLNWLARGTHEQARANAAEALTDFEATKDVLDPNDVRPPTFPPGADGAPVAALGSLAATPAVVPCPAVGAAPGGILNLN